MAQHGQGGGSKGRGRPNPQRRGGAQPGRAGRERAARDRSGGARRGAPPGPPAPPARARPPKPALPGDVPRVRGDVHRDLRAAAPPKELDDVVRAVVAARDLVEGGDPAGAVEMLLWAKAVAPRSVVVRETLGIAAYHAGDFAAAHRELLAYRRLSHRQDQNHLLADCARALGRPEKVEEYVADMAAARVEPERLVEASIVLAGSRADRGDLDGARAVLERAGLDDDEIRPFHPRLWYAAADLAERSGDLARAREYFEAITTVADGFLDVEERLRALG